MFSKFLALARPSTMKNPNLSTAACLVERMLGEHLVQMAFTISLADYINLSNGTTRLAKLYF